MLPVSQIFFSKVSRPSLLQFIVKNSVSILLEPHCLNWYAFFVSALSSLLNGMLHYPYFITAIKLIIYNNIVCFCLKTPKIYLKLHDD